MKKHSFFITNDAVKYWKKEVGSGRLMVANRNEKIYIVNGYNAFVIPANEYIYSQIVQPATLRPMPETGKAYHWNNGDYHEDTADTAANLVDRLNVENIYLATRSAFLVEDNHGDTSRIYRANDGNPAAVNVKFDNMVDFTFKHTISMEKRISPVIIRSDDFVAILMPKNYHELSDRLRELIEG